MTLVRSNLCTALRSCTHCCCPRTVVAELCALSCSHLLRVHGSSERAGLLLCVPRRCPHSLLLCPRVWRHTVAAARVTQLASLRRRVRVARCASSRVQWQAKWPLLCFPPAHCVCGAARPRAWGLRGVWRGGTVAAGRGGGGTGREAPTLQGFVGRRSLPPAPRPLPQPRSGSAQPTPLCSLGRGDAVAACFQPPQSLECAGATSRPLPTVSASASDH